MEFPQVFRYIRNVIPKLQVKSRFRSVTGRRFYSDQPKKVDNKSKQLMVKTTHTKQSLVTRRVRPSDLPNVLRFMRKHSCSTWPNQATPAPTSQMVLNDFISRILAQGHSMLAEQHQDLPCGWTRIRGLALATSYTPWDPECLESFAYCIKSPTAKRLLQFSAHCLRAPALHEKYKVNNVLQVIFIVPEEQDSAEVVNTLVKNILKRAHEGGFPVIRFDANSDSIAKTLEDMKLKKEWQMKFKVMPTDSKDSKMNSVFHIDQISSDSKHEKLLHENASCVTVFSAVLNKAKNVSP